MDELHDEQIAVRLGFWRRALACWKRRPEYRAAAVAAELAWEAEFQERNDKERALIGAEREAARARYEKALAEYRYRRRRRRPRGWWS